MSQSVLVNHKESPDTIDDPRKKFSIISMTILQVATTTAEKNGQATFVLAKPEDKDKKKVAKLGLDRIKVFFACGKDIYLGC
jgi:hypothetical protein